VYRSGAEVRVFARWLNDITMAVPETVETGQQLSAREFIFDGDALLL